MLMSDELLGLQAQRVKKVRQIAQGISNVDRHSSILDGELYGTAPCCLPECFDVQ